MDRWLEKEDLLEQYARNGRFPADEGHDSEGEPAINGNSGKKVQMGAGYIETQVKLTHWFEVGQIWVVLASAALVCNILGKIYSFARYGTFKGV